MHLKKENGQCFRTKTKFLRESGDFVGNRETREFFGKILHTSSKVLQKISGALNKICILIAKKSVFQISAGGLKSFASDIFVHTFLSFTIFNPEIISSGLAFRILKYFNQFSLKHFDSICTDWVTKTVAAVVFVSYR